MHSLLSGLVTCLSAKLQVFLLGKNAGKWEGYRSAMNPMA